MATITFSRAVHHDLPVRRGRRKRPGRHLRPAPPECRGSVPRPHRGAARLTPAPDLPGGPHPASAGTLGRSRRPVPRTDRRTGLPRRRGVRGRPRRPSVTANQPRHGGPHRRPDARRRDHRARDDSDRRRARVDLRAGLPVRRPSGRPPQARYEPAGSKTSLDDLRPFRLVYDVSGPDRHSARKPGPKANAVVRGGKAQRNTVTETRGSGQPRRGRGRPKSAARSAETCTSIVRFPACDGTVRFPPASFARTCDRFRRRRLREAGRCRLTRRRGLRLTSGEHQGAVLGDGDGVFRVSRA